MATVNIEAFGGIAPRQHPSQLMDGMATIAHNCRLKTGKLVPLREPMKVSGITVHMENDLSQIGDAKSLFVWPKADTSETPSFEFIAFPGIVWMAPGNLADDDFSRIIVSGDTGVEFDDESKEDDPDYDGDENAPAMFARTKLGGVNRIPLCKNALPKPKVARAQGTISAQDELVVTPRGDASIAQLNAMSLGPADAGAGFTTTDGGTLASGSLVVGTGAEVVWNGTMWVLQSAYKTENIRYTNFFWTWVDEYGYESPVSPPSDEVQYIDGDAMSLTVDGDEGDVPADVVPDEAVLIRVYKVIAGTETGRIQFVAEFRWHPENPPSAFRFTVKDEDAGETLQEIVSPPADLSCIQKVPGNYYCGFSKSAPKTVMFSDVDLIYSWPDAYRYDVDDRIVALAVTSNNVFVLTDGWPFILSGTAPESMSITKLAGPAACVSPRGVCVYRNAVYFVSNQGLMAIANSAGEGTICQNLTDKIFTKDQWLALNPSSCVMGQHDGALHLFFTAADGGVFNFGPFVGKKHAGLMIDLLENSAIAVTTHNDNAACLAVDVKSDKLYFVKLAEEEV